MKGNSRVVLDAGLAIAVALMISCGSGVAAPVTKGKEVRIEEVRLRPNILGVPRAVSGIVYGTCLENKLGLYVECAKEDEATYFGTQTFPESATFQDVMRYLQGRGLNCVMRGSTLVIRSRKLDRVALNPLDVPFSKRAFKATIGEISDGVMATCAGVGMHSFTGGVRGVAHERQVYSFAEGECETLRELFLSMAKKGGYVFAVITAGTREAPGPVLYFGIN